MKKRTIAVVTTSRADYSHLYWPLRDLAAHPHIVLKLIVYAAHLAPEFGCTVQEIELDGFEIAHRIECLLSSDTDVGMAKTLGLAVLGLADCLGAMRPDLLLIIADRYEMLAPAAVALTLRIPIAHIEGGEVSEGAIDDAVRNAITKMAHLHFTSTENARQRVIALGEEPWRVHRAGAPSLDHLRRSRLLTRPQLEQALGIPLTLPPIVVATHPVTLLPDTTAEMDALFSALTYLPHFGDQFRGRAVLFCYPNADAGSHRLIERTRAFCDEHPASANPQPDPAHPAQVLERFRAGVQSGLASFANDTPGLPRPVSTPPTPEPPAAGAHLFVNLPAITYWSLLAHAHMLIGNSSSGIMEAASFALPVVNIGLRQQGRERAPNVLDAAPDAATILARIGEAASPAFQESLAGMQNPYGDGHAAERIVEVLATAPLHELLQKRAQP